MKIKIENVLALPHIYKLAVLQREAKRIERDYLKAQKKLQDFFSEIDEGYDFDEMSIDEKIFELNIIMNKSDELLEEVKILKLFLTETFLQLAN